MGLEGKPISMWVTRSWQEQLRRMAMAPGEAPTEMLLDLQSQILGVREEIACNLDQLRSCHEKNTMEAWWFEAVQDAEETLNRIDDDLRVIGEVLETRRSLRIQQIEKPGFWKSLWRGLFKR